MKAPQSQPNQRVSALIIEDDPLTLWSLRSYLDPSFKVEVACTLDEALLHLKEPSLKVIICGSPIVDRDPNMLQQLAQNPDYTVIGLVSDTACINPGNAVVVEKPFALEQLAQVLDARNASAVKHDG